jgi:hypothetical protein
MWFEKYKMARDKETLNCHEVTCDIEVQLYFHHLTEVTNGL